MNQSPSRLTPSWGRGKKDVPTHRHLRRAFESAGPLILGVMAEAEGSCFSLPVFVQTLSLLKHKFSLFAASYVAAVY